MPDAPLGGAKWNRTLDDIKREHRKATEKLRNAALADGYPPGTVPIRDTAHQRTRLVELAQKGPLSPAEAKRLRDLAGGGLL